MSGEVCSDNRFELIDKAKAKLLEATNIETHPDEMMVLDNILFRCWQMGWLDQLREEIVRCRDCKEFTLGDIECATVDWCDYWGAYVESPDGFCAWGERRDA